VAFRYLKVPTQVPREIESIVSLQASRYLPYPANELITGSQVILAGKEGYSGVNIIIVHKDVIERYLKIFKELNIKDFSIVLSSYGLGNLYSYINPQETGPVMIIDIDSYRVELVIVSDKKVSFSRFLKLNRLQANWENLFIEEINKTSDAYLKETSLETPHKIIIFGLDKNSQEFAEILNRQMALPVEVLSFSKKINFSESALNSIIDSVHSFASLIGLGLKDTEESLNLLPQEIKEKTRKISRYKERLRIILSISCIIAIWILAMVKNLDNKVRYLERLKIELDKVAKEARPLEEIEKKLGILEIQSARKTSSLDMLYELYQAIPPQISLINFSYEEDSQIVLRGQTQELDAVFGFVSQLEKSAILKNFNVKVRYASKKKTQSGDIVDFEIICLKSK